MGSARYIGRVGGLAVALGVGTAIAMGHGVAFADATDTESSNTTPSDPSPAGGVTPQESTSTQTTGTSPTTSKSTPSAGSSPGSSTTAETPGTGDATEKTSSTTTSHLGPDVVVSAQTTTGTSSSTETAKKPEEPAATPAVLPPAETTTSPTDTKDPKDTKEEPTSRGSSKSTNEAGGSGSAPVAAAAVSARTVSTVAEPATKDDEPDTAPVAVAADPASSGVTITAMAAAVVVRPAPAPEPVAAVPEAPLAAVTSLVSSVINWVLGPMAGTAPTTPAQPPSVWTLLAFARREFENVLSRFGVGGTADATLAVASTSLALAAAQPVPVVNVPAFPLPGAQLSPSTQFVNWVTGDYQTGNALMADTLNRFGISGTDVGVIWDNGIPDDPRTPYNEHQVLMAFGDTFGNRSVPGEEWRFNTLLRSSDTTLGNGMDIPNGEWFNGNMFGGTPLGNPTFGRQVIGASGLPAGVTLIPTAGISIPTPGTRFGATQYVNFMSVSQWGAPGQWTTNYSAIAYSVDNGENWTVAPSTVRYNQPWGGNQNFQQAAYVRPGDGYVYTYGTPNGRQGAAYVARVPDAAILDLTQYEYYSKGQAGFFGWGATPAGWIKNNPAAASPVFGQEGGACGAVNAGNTVSELSVQYNKQLGKFVTLYTDQNNSVVMRTSSTAQGTWSNASVLVTQQPGGIYAPMMHPWSPSTMGTGTDLYWNLSNWNEYNVMLMRTDLTKV
jgi:hypothetical protein